MKLDPRRYPELTRLVAKTEVERTKTLDENTGGKYEMTFFINADLSHLLTDEVMKSEDHMGDLADKLSSVQLEKEFNRDIWQTIRHKLPGDWIESVDVTNIEIEPSFEFDEDTVQLKEKLKKASLVVQVAIQYEMPASARVECDELVGDYLQKYIDGIK